MGIGDLYKKAVPDSLEYYVIKAGIVGFWKEIRDLMSEVWFLPCK
jgi:hypothetical protein